MNWNLETRLVNILLFTRFGVVIHINIIEFKKKSDPRTGKTKVFGHVWKIQSKDRIKNKIKSKGRFFIQSRDWILKTIWSKDRVQKQEKAVLAPKKKSLDRFFLQKIDPMTGEKMVQGPDL